MVGPWGAMRIFDVEEIRDWNAIEKRQLLMRKSAVGKVFLLRTLKPIFRFKYKRKMLRFLKS